VGESNLLIRVTPRASFMGVSIWYLAWPVTPSTRVVRRGESRESRSVQPLIEVLWGIQQKRSDDQYTYRDEAGNSKRTRSSAKHLEARHPQVGLVLSKYHISHRILVFVEYGVKIAMRRSTSLKRFLWTQTCDTSERTGGGWET